MIKRVSSTWFLALSLLYAREWREAVLKVVRDTRTDMQNSALSVPNICAYTDRRTSDIGRQAGALAHRRRGPLKVYSLRRTTRLSSTLANSRQSVLLVPRIAIMKPLTLLYRAINLNITTRVSRNFGLSDLSPGEDRDVT